MLDLAGPLHGPAISLNVCEGGVCTMKDFDAERHERHAQLEAEMGDRAFVLGGVTFHFRPVTSYTVMGEIGSGQDITAAELIGIMEQSLVKMLEPGQEEKFLAILRSDDDPLDFQDLTDLVGWVAEQQTGRPTKASSPSTGGDAPTSTTSTDDSSSKPAVVSAA
jgi:hypothetical protein